MRSSRLFSVGALLALVSTCVVAQQTGPAYINARIVTVKADSVSQWEGLIEERSSFRRAQGQSFYHVYQRLRGPLHTYLIITPAADIGPQLAGAPPTPLDVQNWATALNSTIASESVTTLQTYPDAHTLQTESLAPPTDFMHVRLRVAAPGRSQEYYEWQANELIPALRAADVGDVRVSRVALGGNIRSWIRFSFVNGWPGDGADRLAASMGERPAERMLARGEAMTAGASTDYFYRLRPEMSFTAN